jgi:cytochrome c oxidase cbb3-type subunit 2
MPTASSILKGWRAIALIAITYVYFLIFAQFAFLQRLAEFHIIDPGLKPVMASMAIGGILFSLIAARLQTSRFSASTLLRTGLLLCATAALLSTANLSFPAAVAIAFLIGTGLGLLTVTLVTHLSIWLNTSPETPGVPFMRSPWRGGGEPQQPAPTQTALLQVGLGTGLGYLLCNIPALFTAPARTQSLTAAILCLLGLFAASIKKATQPVPSESTTTTPAPSFLRILLAFTALVWLDSAAFFIIQGTPALKAGTWEGNAHLSVNGALHLIAAVASAWLLRRRGTSFVLSAAFLTLATACLLLLDPHRALLASVFYPIGVSLYSVALVAYPALLFDPSRDTTTAERARRAGLIYAIAGWCGSALGIGMGQNLGHVPALFVASAGLVVLSPALLALLQHRRRELLATTAVLLLAFAIHWTFPTRPAPTTAVERGRQVYIAEGCIHCHSQYVRPNTADVRLWGPTETLAQLRAQHPPLIGNRRQGPDLSQVGRRRSPAWLRAHFIDPRQLSPTSFMPSYAYLFDESSRGADLVAYVSSLNTTQTTSGETK